MNQEAFGLIFTGEANPYMRDLTMSRAVAAVPFGGRFFAAAMCSSRLAGVTRLAQ